MTMLVILFGKYPNFAHFIITEGKVYLNVVVTVADLELSVFLQKKRGSDTFLKTTLIADPITLMPMSLIVDFPVLAVFE